MKALFVLAVVVLALLLAGQIRLGGRAEFNAQGFFLWIRLGRFQIKLLPMKQKREKTTPQKPKEPTKKKEPKRRKKERPPAPLTEKLGGALEYAQALLPVGLEAAKGLWRGLRVDVLICGGIGGGAWDALAQAGIKPCSGVTGGADEAVNAFLSGTLEYSSDVQCSHHGYEHHGGHCGENKHGCGGKGGNCGA